MGRRPIELTKARHAKIVKACEGGSYREPAAAAAGISERTLYRWLEEGEADDENGRATPYRRLWQAVKKAEAAAEVEAVAIVLDAGRDGNWQAAMTFLERKYPHKWGRRLKVTDDTPRPPAPLHGQTVAEFEANFEAAFGEDLDIEPSQMMPGFFESSDNGASGNGAGP